jgi:hypothetical protein
MVVVGPSSPMRVTIERARPGSAISTLSVISSSSRSGATPAVSSAAPISSGRRVSIRSRADRFTDTGTRRPSVRQCAAWPRAVCSTHIDSSRIRPLRSASGMN